MKFGQIRTQFSMTATEPGNRTFSRAPLAVVQRLVRGLLGITLVLIGLTSQGQWLKTSGKKIVDQNGTEVILRGMGLGGWMLQEPYMMEMSGIAVAQWQIKSKIRDLIGPDQTDAFYDAWHASHCTRKDIDSMASWGFNSVRLPMHYNLFTLPIEEEPVQGVNTWLEKGFVMTDSLIRWCADHHMYVILDLHAAPAGQGKDYAICDGNPALSSLWESEANKQKTIALWRKLAERYANEPWVGGYDLINEPNWSFTAGGNQNGCTENSNAPLRQLYVAITNAIRQVDTRHLIIIEGNCWGNNYNGIFPTWDPNTVASFHKYWSYNDQNSIQGILNIRSQNNVPIWLGESGENSNVWFTDAISLVEKNGIGWAWWPLKKINSVVDPLMIVKTAGYQTLLDYWKNGGTKPTAQFAYYTLMQMATNANIEFCTYQKDVIDAMFRQVYDSTTRPFKAHRIPGVVATTNFDLGRLEKAYSDSDVADYHVSTGTYTDWNSGGRYRNDAVDIATSKDAHNLSNGFYVGWTKDNEWMQYTAPVDSTAAYRIQLRYAGPSGSAIRLSANGADLTKVVTVPSSGSYTTWADLFIEDVILYKGVNKLRLNFGKGGVNTGFLNFEISKPVKEIPFRSVSAETYQNSECICLSLNKRVTPSAAGAPGFACTVNGTPVTITNLRPNETNSMQLIFEIDRKIYYRDTILVSYNGSNVMATDSTMLEPFSGLPVKNNLPVYLAIPGKIEAEDFSFNQGLQAETCTDIGGGKDMGYTNAGDYLDYQIDVFKAGLYGVEVRIACNSSAGIIQFQQLDLQGNLLNVASVNVPVTGGWQTWRTVLAEMNLTEGISKLRMKIIQPEFNINWYRFTVKTQGMADPAGVTLEVYPNPVRDELTLLTPKPGGGTSALRFLDLRGSVIKEMMFVATGTTQTFDVSDLPTGFYILEMVDSGSRLHRKIIKSP